MPLTTDEIEAEREHFEAWTRKTYAGNADLAYGDIPARLDQWQKERAT